MRKQKTENRSQELQELQNGGSIAQWCEQR